MIISISLFHASIAPKALLFCEPKIQPSMFAIARVLSIECLKSVPSTSSSNNCMYVRNHQTTHNSRSQCLPLKLYFLLGCFIGGRVRLRDSSSGGAAVSRRRRPPGCWEVGGADRTEGIRVKGSSRFLGERAGSIGWAIPLLPLSSLLGVLSVLS